MAPSTNGQRQADTEESDTETGLCHEEAGGKEASVKTPEPTFENEPRYAQPPDTPKRSPEKRTEQNPLLKLAVILASHWSILLIQSSYWSRCPAALAAARSHSRQDKFIFKTLQNTLPCL